MSTQTQMIDLFVIGGGMSNGSHLNGSADLALETLRAVDTPWDAGDVTIHFDGGAAGTGRHPRVQRTGAERGG